MEGRARSLRLTTIAKLVLSASLSVSSAAAAVPTALDQGFPLETFDPAPAGDRFVSTPDAYIGQAVSVRAVTDYAARPIDVRLNGASITQSSYAWYAHLGLAASLCRAFMVSGDMPVVLSQRAQISDAGGGYPAGSLAQDPSTGDVGDIRLGFRLGLLPQERKGLLNAGLAGDFWLRTGNPETLTGAPANRWRGEVLVSGRLPVCLRCSLELEYAAALGLQGYFADVSDMGIAAAIPLRFGAGLVFPVQRWGLRPTFEYAGNVPLTGAGLYPRDTHEVLPGFYVATPNDRWSFGASLGLGASEAPGVPTVRGLVSVSYRAPTGG